MTLLTVTGPGAEAPSIYRVRLASAVAGRLTYCFGHAKRQTPREIVAMVAAKNGLTVDEIRSPDRSRRIAHARQEAMWELRQRTRLSMPGIARHVGVGDHTTVLHGLRAHEKRMQQG